MRRPRIHMVISIGFLLLFLLLCVHIQLQDSLLAQTDGILASGLNQDWPQCEPAWSAAEAPGFGDLAPHIQDFLLYHHCRHFPLILDVPDKCEGSVFLLLVIKSSPGNYDQREVLRKTWARERQLNNLWIRRVFISGTKGTGDQKTRLNELLRLEQSEHRDILQWDFEDSFFNLTLKQLLFLEWTKQRCSSARFMLNGDDDVFANTDGMVDYLQELPGNHGSSHLYTGFVIDYSGPIRDKSSKYYVPELIQASDFYPPYCGGGGYLLSAQTAMEIQNVSKYIEVHPIDDVYIGMCVERAGRRPTAHVGVKTVGLQITQESKLDEQEPCFVRELLLVHRFVPAQIYLMWKRLQQQNLRCGLHFWN